MNKIHIIVYLIMMCLASSFALATLDDAVYYFPMEEGTGTETANYTGTLVLDTWTNTVWCQTSPASDEALCGQVMAIGSFAPSYGGSQQMTWTYWAYSDDSGTYNYPWAQVHGAYMIGARFTNSNVFSGLYGTGSGWVYADVNPSPDGWVMITQRANSTHWSTFIGETLISSNSVSLNAGAPSSIAIGSTGGVDGIKGGMDNFLIYDRALSQEEITELYNDGDGLNPYNPVATTFINLLTPTNNILLYPLTNFSYNFTDNIGNINNCSLLFNGAIVNTDTNPTNDTTNYFNNIDTSPYNNLNWGIICGNTTTTNYSLNRGSLNISAYSKITGDTINAFSISVGGDLNGSTSVGNYTIGNLTGGSTINVTINALGYELKSQLFNISSINNFYNFSLYDTNSLNITIYDETTGIQMSQNVTMIFNSDSSEFTNISEDGKFYYSGLVPEEFQAIFFSNGYSNRTYIITVSNRSHQFIDIYLAAGSSSTLFTITDSNTDVALSDVLLYTSKFIVDDWVTVESKYSDITGRVKVNYVDETNYRFYLSKDGYDDLIFNLNPILFSSYNIKMEQSTLLNYSFNLDNIAIVYGPHTFNNTQVTNFTFLISSPYGSLTDYGINLTYPGGSNYISGSNAIGGTLTTLINISNATVFDTVKLNYFYITTVSGRRNFTDEFPITFPEGTGTLTYMANKNKTFGLGIFERVLTTTLIAIFIVGIASLVGQPLPGFALNLFIQSYLTYIGFIPVWITLPSLLLGIMILIWKSGGV